MKRCLLSTSPDYIIQGRENLAKSVYWKRCDGRYLNLCKEELGEQPNAHADKNSEPVEQGLTSTEESW